MGKVKERMLETDLESTDASSGRDSDNVDRIVLRRAESVKLEGWMATLNARFGGMVKVTKSDLANFVIRQHAASLSDAEIDSLESEHFDEVRWLNWALVKIRQAKKEGLVLSLNDLMMSRKLKGSDSVQAKARRRKGRKDAQSVEPDSTISENDSIENPLQEDESNY